MGTSYPGAIDALTNPNASDMLDDPPHATQHSDANDALEAIETKLGTGASVPTTVGHVLKVTGAGATAYAAPAPTLTVKESDGAPSVSDVDTIAFSGATVTDNGSGDVTITVPSSLSVEEVDGSPAVTAVDKLIFPNGTVTDSGSGDVTIRDVPVGFIGAKVFHSVAESVASAAIVPLSMNNEEFDTDGFHDNVTNNSRLTIPAGLGGKYLVNAGAYFASSAVGLREVYVLKNGTAMRNNTASIPPSDGNGLRLSTSLVLDLAPGDYVQMAVVQTSGGALDTGSTATDNARNSLSIAKLDSGKVGQGVGAAVTCNTTVTTLPTATWTSVVMDAEHYDTDGFHSNTVNNTRLTVPAGMGGLYLISGAVHFDTSSTGDRGIRILMNGGTSLAESVVPAGVVPARLGCMTALKLEAGAYIELQAWQSSGGNLNTITSNYGHPQLIAVRLDSGAANYTGPLWGSGTAFPSGPSVNQRFTRTDRGIDYYYDGTRWLSTTLYCHDFSIPDNLTTAGSVWGAGWWSSGVATSIQFVAFDTAMYVGTTNDASNYWTAQLRIYDGATSAAVTELYTSAQSANTMVRGHVALATVVSDTTDAIYLSLSKTGTPGPLYGGAKLLYRLIG